MPRTRVQRVGPESASLQAFGLLCSSGKGLMGRRVMYTGEADYFRDYKRLGAIAKLATSYYGLGGADDLVTTLPGALLKCVVVVTVKCALPRPSLPSLYATVSARP